MDKYKNFSVEDFLQDEFFRRWVKEPFSKNAGLWERWVDCNPQMQEIIGEAKNILLAFDYEPRELPVNFHLKLKSRIDTTISNYEQKQTRTFWGAHWLKLAAIFAGLIVAASIILQSAAENEFFTYNTKYAQTKKIVLPDGSHVVLNANSSLKYKRQIENGSREVWLEGEGFFSIRTAKDTSDTPLKFIVHTKDVNIEVLGTEFNVNTNGERKTSVLLTKGKVRISVVNDNKKPLNMVPGELVEYDTKTKHIGLQNVTPESHIAWLQHKYIFEKATLEEVARELHRYYGKPVIITDSIMRKKRLSGTLELKDENILIETLSVLLGVQVNKDDNRIIISSQ